MNITLDAYLTFGYMKELIYYIPQQKILKVTYSPKDLQQYQKYSNPKWLGLRINLNFKKI